MNVKLIARAMHTLSLLSEEDVAMVMKLRGLSDDERQTLLLVLEPDKPQKKPAKKSSAKSPGKSARASGMAAAINRSLESSRQAAVTTDNDGDNINSTLCIVGIDSKGESCDQPADANVHHLSTHPDYHEFEAGSKPATDAAHAAAGE